MYKRSKSICFIVLSCFLLSAAASTTDCGDIFDKVDTQKNPVETANQGCHSDKHNPSQDSPEKCCQEMSLCHSSISFFVNFQPETLQIIKQPVQLPANEQCVLMAASPPVRPPKPIN